MQDNKEYTVIISERAKRMLGSHIRFLAQVDKAAATTRKNEIISALHSLSNMPYRYPVFRSPFLPPDKYRRMYIKNFYLAIYQIKDSTVYVDYILDCRNDNLKIM